MPQIQLVSRPAGSSQPDKILKFATNIVDIFSGYTKPLYCE